MADDLVQIDPGFVVKMLDTLPAKGMAAVRRGLKRAVLIIHREAVKNAPVSPTNAQYSKAVLKRKKRTKQRMHPGGLSRSIEWEVAGNEGSVYVAENSEAARYAKVIHDERYKRWKNRGPGTIAKGSRAREKFIERALADNLGKVNEILDAALGKAVEEAGNGQST